MSRKHKRIILEVSRAAIIAVGMLLSVLSPFIDLSPIMDDWRINLATGLFLTFVGIIWYLIDLNRKFLWEEPVLELSTVTELEMAQGNHFPASAKLVVYNDEEQEVTECYATLLSAKNLYGGEMIPVDMVNEERLKWREEGFSNELCEMKIPPKDKRNVMVASNMNGFQFDVCKSRIMRHDLLGIHLIKIRIDAKFGGRNMKPQFFNGYLYINNQFHEMRATETVSGHDVKGEFFEKKREISEPSVITTMIFEEGDWMKDKRIPKLGKVGQAK